MLVRIPLSWYLSRLPQADLFHIGFAAPLASLVSLGLCAAYLWRSVRQERLSAGPSVQQARLGRAQQGQSGITAGSNELKSKPTQHSCKELLSLGIQPDVIVCRGWNATA